MKFISEPVVQSIKLKMGQPLNQSSVGCIQKDLDDIKRKEDPRKHIMSPKGRKMIRKHEGLAKVRADGLVQAYLCPAGVWTIGYGSTGPGIRQGLIWTVDECIDRMNRDLEKFEQYVRKMVGTNATQDQFDALVSFAYNLGPEALRRSTLLRKHNEGDYEGAAAEFAKWVYGGGRKLKGLVKRRAEEAALYRGEL